LNDAFRRYVNERLQRRPSRHALKYFIGSITEAFQASTLSNSREDGPGKQNALLMLTQAENDMLTRVGPATPAGELLRRYWHVAGASCELSEEKPIKPVRMFGEDLVLFRMPPAPGQSEATYGLVGERCSHRHASLQHGMVDCEGIRCIYHGWKYAPNGACIEQPPEGRASTFKDRVRQAAYPVKKLAGLLFAYMGPLPAPELPRWDLLVREDGRRWGMIESVIECNWLQTLENAVDPSHLWWLHGLLGTRDLPVGKARYDALGLPADFEEEHDFFQFEYGIMKRRITPSRKPGGPKEQEQHPLVFPTGLRLVISTESIIKQGWRFAETLTEEEKAVGHIHNMHFRTPIDDEHTMHYNVSFVDSKNRMSADEDPPFEVIPFKDENNNYRLQHVTAQDVLAWESQGAVMDRSKEHLGADDRGVIMLRKLVREQIEIVQSGGDPLGTIRDPSRNAIVEFDLVHEPFGLFRKEKSLV
jgi:5,5'-dehydrodivanillate O-demethylase oxygenase subunit